jgi:hypothetical protein
VYPCASERRLQRADEERTTSQSLFRVDFFRAQVFRAIDAPQGFSESPFHPATQPNAEALNTNTRSPAVIVLLRTVV